MSDRKSLQVDTVVAARHCLALGTAGARHLEPAASEAARQSTEQPGSLMAMTSPQRLTQAEAIFFFPSLLSLGSAVEQIEHDYVLNLNSD